MKSRWKLFLPNRCIPCFYCRYLHFTILQALYLRIHFKSFQNFSKCTKNNEEKFRCVIDLKSKSDISDSAYILDCCCNFNILWTDHFYSCNNTYGIGYFIQTDSLHHGMKNSFFSESIRLCKVK